MRIVEMRVNAEVPNYGRLNAGKQYSLDDETADLLIRSRAGADIETAQLRVPENAAVRVGRPARRDPVAAQWSLKMSPADYLLRYPDGKHAVLARRIVE